MVGGQKPFVDEGSELEVRVLFESGSKHRIPVCEFYEFQLLSLGESLRKPGKRRNQKPVTGDNVMARQDAENSAL